MAPGQALAERLYDGITGQLDGVVLNGPGGMDGRQRYLGNLNLSFAYVEGESLLMGLKVCSPCSPWRLKACLRPFLKSAPQACDDLGKCPIKA